MKFLFLFAALPLFAGQWVRTESEGISVFTDAGEETAREAMQEALRMRSVFVQVTGGLTLSAVPLRAYIFRNLAQFAEYRPLEGAAGFFTTGNDADYLVVHTGPELEHHLRHELTHAFLAHAGLPRNSWLNEGMAELFSTTSFKGGSAQVGAPPLRHLEKLRSGPMGSVAELLHSIHPSYPQSWALVHMLIFSKRYASALPSLIEEGVLPKLPTLDRDLRSYVAADQFSTVNYRLPDLRVNTQAASVSPPTASLALADLAVATGHSEKGKALLATVAQPDRDVLTALGEIALSERDGAAAAEYFEHASTAGQPTGRLLWDLAMLARERGAAETEVAQRLRSALQADGEFFDAHLLLGTWALRDGRRAEAAEHLEAARKIRPYRRDVREQLADARSTPKPAALAAPAQIPAVAATLAVEGLLTGVECLGESARLRIRTSGGNIFVLLRGKLSGLPLELPCGDVKEKRAVRVEHDGVSDPPLGTAGVAQTVVFR